MLTSKDAQQYAHRFLEARAKGETLNPLSTTLNDFSIEDGYQIGMAVDRIRTNDGEVFAGRKLGWTNRATWATAPNKKPLTAPTWASLFSSTIRYLDEPHAIQSLKGALRPKIEPEVVFKLARAPSTDATPEEVADCLEWMAHGLELVVSPYPEACSVADALAALGMHGMLIVSEPRILSSATRQHLGTTLANASVSMTRDNTLIGAGYGSNVMENPLMAIWHLHQLLKTNPLFPPLKAGEIITSGTWMGASPIKAGETWTSAFSGVSIPGISISFV